MWVQCRYVAGYAAWYSMGSVSMANICIQSTDRICSVFAAFVQAFLGRHRVRLMF